MAQEEAKEKNEIILEFQHKEVESKTTLEVMLPSDSQIHFYALHYPILGVEVNITKQALFSFSISKIRDKALYEMISLSASHTSFGRSWLINYVINYKGHDQGQALSFASLPPPPKYNPRKVYEKILFMSKIRLRESLVRASHYFSYSRVSQIHVRK